MTALYELQSAAASPVSLADMKSYMKVTSASDDDLIQVLIDAATAYGERYTTRDFRIKSWKLLLDEFDDRICLRRSPVNSITSVEYLVSSVLTPIASSVYYLKKGVQFSEILLQEDQEWPDDLDEREQGIEIVFATVAYNAGNAIKIAIKRWVSFAYANRGDCDCQSEALIGKQSGADFTLDQFRISRI